MDLFEEHRREYHRQICEQILFLDANGVPSNADKHNETSAFLARSITEKMAFPLRSTPASGQTSGNLFERITADYLQKAFLHLDHLRPGKWSFQLSHRVEEFEQYEHLEGLSKILKSHKELRATLGDYLIMPDIIIGRIPLDDCEINQKEQLITGPGEIASLTPIRRDNSNKPILHASISCKWTIRSDRSQNARTEGLNLIRNRKGNTPHIMIVTAEPYPQRIASIALGTGDIDCVYHIALPELLSAVKSLGNNAVSEMLDVLVVGKRLRDISDLPFDLAV